MQDKCEVKRTCSFNVSNWHLVTMIIPYINRRIEENINILTFFEDNMEEIIKTFLNKLILNESAKDKIRNLNWKGSKKSIKFGNLSSLLENCLIKEDSIDLIVSGKKEYISFVNSNINKWISANEKRIIGRKINIINCYEITQFNNNIRDILEIHDDILNTSGKREIEEVFEGYEKNII